MRRKGNDWTPTLGTLAEGREGGTGPHLSFFVSAAAAEGESPLDSSFGGSTCDKDRNCQDGWRNDFLRPCPARRARCVSSCFNQTLRNGESKESTGPRRPVYKGGPGGPGPPSESK